MSQPICVSVPEQHRRTTALAEAFEWEVVYRKKRVDSAIEEAINSVRRKYVYVYDPNRHARAVGKAVAALNAAIAARDAYEEAVDAMARDA